jgi:hypothetical protein
MNPNGTVRVCDRDYAANLIHTICCLAGPASLLDDIRFDLRETGVFGAIRRHDTGAIFDWLVAGLSHQGISDTVARGYMDRHGQATWAGITRDLRTAPPCPKLESYWQFHDCRYHKGSATCAEPDHMPACPLPRYRLRNGRLNQTAFSLFLFIRDLAAGDLVGWIDGRLAEADSEAAPDIGSPGCETRFWSLYGTSTGYPTRS